MGEASCARSGGMTSTCWITVAYKRRACPPLGERRSTSLQCAHMATTRPRDPFAGTPSATAQRILDTARDGLRRAWTERVPGRDRARRRASASAPSTAASPTRSQLIDALFEDRLGEIRRTAEESIEIERPLAGARATSSTRSLELQVADRGLKELLLSGTSDGHALLERGRRADPADRRGGPRARPAGRRRARRPRRRPTCSCCSMRSAKSRTYTRESAPEVWRRLLVISLDGLRPDRRRPSAMLAEPLDDEQMVCAMRDWAPRRRPAQAR